VQADFVCVCVCVYVVVLEFELRALRLQSRCFVT
jgi:hypothetical protein